MRIFTLIMALLLVFSFTTSLLGRPTPSLEKVLDKLSSVSGGVDAIQTLFSLNLTSLDDYRYELPEDPAWYDELLYALTSGLMNTVGAIISGLSALLGLFFYVLTIIEFAVSFIEIALYLLFGMDINIQPAGVDTSPVPAS